MKLIPLLFILLSCSISKNGIKSIPEYQKCTLISKPERVLKNSQIVYKLTLIASNGDTLKRYESRYSNWIVGECYLVIK